MLKFGRIVDLDRLEGLHINKTAEDLRMKIEAVERRRAQTVLDMEVQSRGWGLGVGGWGTGLSFCLSSQHIVGGTVVLCCFLIHMYL